MVTLRHNHPIFRYAITTNYIFPFYFFYTLINYLKLLFIFNQICPLHIFTLFSFSNKTCTTRQIQNIIAIIYIEYVGTQTPKYSNAWIKMGLWFNPKPVTQRTTIKNIIGAKNQRILKAHALFRFQELKEEIHIANHPKKLGRKTTERLLMTRHWEK